MLSHLKHKQNFTKFAMDLDIDTGTLNRMFHRMIDVIASPLKAALCRPQTMSDLRKEGKSFDSLKNLLLVVDVHFQQSNRPGRFSDSKHYFLGKHFQYGLKVETAHYANGLMAFKTVIIQVVPMTSVFSVATEKITLR
jgi:hypothetical protein